MGRYIACAFVGMWISCGTATAEFISLACSADTFVTANASCPSNANGDQSSLPLLGGGLETIAIPLVQFDLRPYEGRQVLGAYAYVRQFLTDAPYNPLASQTVELHASQIDWTEAAVSLADFAAEDGFRPESVGPVLSTIVIEWEETPHYVTWKIPRSLVQAWIDSPASNKGLAFLSTTAATDQLLCLASRENRVGAPPRLEFTLAAVPEPSGIMLLAVGGSVLLLGGICGQRVE